MSARTKTKTTLRYAHSAAGFTLVELMVVVAIIGVLAAVAGPRVQVFRARGMQAEAKANLNSIYLAQAAFQDVNDRYATGLTCEGGSKGGGDCLGTDGPEFMFRNNKGAKYNYGVEADSANAGWAAGAASVQPMLRGRTDKWRTNTNKEMCAVDDVTIPVTTNAYTCRIAGEAVDTDGSVTYNGTFDAAGI